MYLFPEQRFELTFKDEGYLIACKDVHGTLWNERKWHKCSPTSWVCHQPHLPRNIPHKTFLAHLKHLLHTITLDLRLDLKTVSQKHEDLTTCQLNRQHVQDQTNVTAQQGMDRKLQL